MKGKENQSVFLWNFQYLPHSSKVCESIKKKLIVEMSKST